MTAEKRFGNQYPTQSVILPITETKYQVAIETFKKLSDNASLRQEADREILMCKQAESYKPRARACRSSKAMTVVSQTVDNHYISAKVDGMRNTVERGSPCCVR